VLELSASSFTEVYFLERKEESGAALRTPTLYHSRFLEAGAWRRESQQFMKLNIESVCDFFQRPQTGIAFDAQLVKLKNLLPETATLCCLLLSPAPLQSERAYPLPKSC
jgi:hypothetical protein